MMKDLELTHQNSPKRALLRKTGEYIDKAILRFFKIPKC